MANSSRSDAAMNNPNKANDNTEDRPNRDKTNHADRTNDTRYNDREKNFNLNKPCHYFAVNGRCNYEERTGNKCKFAHEPRKLNHQVTMCPLGLNCSRPKCPNSHPKVPHNWINYPNQGFLGNFQNGMHLTNPWQAQYVLNPWIPQMNQNTVTHQNYLRN